MEKLPEEQIPEYRPLLFSVAYNMLGSIMDAEDIVQDTLGYWYNHDQSHVNNPRLYLIKAVSNRCINHLKQLQRTRKAYTGTWLPEPFVDGRSESDVYKFDQGKELSIGFLYLLETLNPLERAVLILKESFDIPYHEIADIFNVTQENCRQLFSRAKRKLKKEKRKFSADKEQHNIILQKFLEACVNGDMKELIALLKDDVTFYSDGGGKVSAATQPLYGRDTVLKFISGILQKTGPVSSVEIASVNGLSGAIIYIDAERTIPDLLIALDVDDDNKIQNLYFIRNPAKLQHLSTPQ